MILMTYRQHHHSQLSAPRIDRSRSKVVEGVIGGSTSTTAASASTAALFDSRGRPTCAKSESLRDGRKCERVQKSQPMTYWTHFVRGASGDPQPDRSSARAIDRRFLDRRHAVKVGLEFIPVTGDRIAKMGVRVRRGAGEHRI